MPRLDLDNPVTRVPAADAHTALAHFERLLAFETDCWDVHAALTAGQGGFVVLDVRGPDAFAGGHVPGAVNIPHRRINQRLLSVYAADTLFVVYCNGPHCNGADRAAIAVARLGRPVKKMIGGVRGWLDEGFELTAAPGARTPRAGEENGRPHEERAPVPESENVEAGSREVRT